MLGRYDDPSIPTPDTAASDTVFAAYELVIGLLNLSIFHRRDLYHAARVNRAFLSATNETHLVPKFDILRQQLGTNSDKFALVGKQAACIKNEYLFRWNIDEVNHGVDAEMEHRGFAAVVGGADHCLALDAIGNVYGWGANKEGQLGFPIVPEDVALPDMVDDDLVHIPLPARAVDIWAGNQCSFVRTIDGNIYAFGSNICGQLGIGNSCQFTATPTLVPLPAGENVRRIFSKNFKTYIEMVSGRLYASGQNEDWNELGAVTRDMHENCYTLALVPLLTQAGETTLGDKEHITAIDVNAMTVGFATSRGRCFAVGRGYNTLHPQYLRTTLLDSRGELVKEFSYTYNHFLSQTGKLYMGDKLTKIDQLIPSSSQINSIKRSGVNLLLQMQDKTLFIVRCENNIVTRISEIAANAGGSLLNCEVDESDWGKQNTSTASSSSSSASSHVSKEGARPSSMKRTR